ncbi:MAG: hypothetical protein H0T39_13105 [Actinobacteria bacterium]|nr:hypothetical protein [Actinomycetota bacterium]
MSALAALVTSPYWVAAIVLAAIAIVLAAILREPKDPQARNWFSQGAIYAAGLGWICVLVGLRDDGNSLVGLGLISGCLLAPSSAIVGLVGFRVWGGRWMTVAGIVAALSLPAAVFAELSECGPGCFS